jgi:hypothetical protein
MAWERRGDRVEGAALALKHRGALQGSVVIEVLGKG